MRIPVLLSLPVLLTLGCPAAPPPARPRVEPERRPAEARPEPERRPAEPARPTEPPSAYKAFFTAMHQGKALGPAYLGYERTPAGATFELKQQLTVPWGEVAHHVVVETDAAFRPIKIVANEMELETQSTFRIHARYEVECGADSVVVTTTRFQRRFKTTYAAGPVPLLRYPLLAAYVLARAWKPGSSDASLATLDPVTGRTEPVKITAKVTGGETVFELTLASGDTARVQYDHVWAKLLGISATGKLHTYQAGGKPPSILPAPSAFSRAVDVTPFAWPPAIRTAVLAVKVSGGVTLEGTLALPAAPARAPVVVILPRLHTGDADGTSGLRKPYAELAAFLAGAGYASFRFAPRASLSPAESEKLRLSTLDADLKLILDALRKDARVNGRSVFLLGHGEGGLVATLYAAQRPNDLKGILLLSTPGVPYQDYVIEGFRRRWESAGMALAVVDQRAAWFKAQLAKVAAGQLKEFLARPAGVMADLMKLDIFSAFKKVRVPALILAGTADITVRLADVNALRAAMPANKKVTVIQPDKVGHLFQESSRLPHEAFEEWKDPAPLAPSVMKALTEWLAANKGK
jgi:hypothetical protein